jgi:hypothetical protein
MKVEKSGQREYKLQNHTVNRQFLKSTSEDSANFTMNFLAWLEVVISLHSFREQTKVISRHFFLDHCKILAIT